LGTTSGWLAAEMGWYTYFIFTGLLMLPALLIINTESKTLFKEKWK
jgi:hypothetical protein